MSAVFGSSFPLNMYNYAQIVPLPNGRFAVDRYDTGFYTGDIVMGVYELDTSGAVSVVDELATNDLSAITGGASYCIVKTGANRWVLFAPQDGVIAGFVLESGTVSRTDGVIPPTTPDIAFGFPVGVYAGGVDYGLVFDPDTTLYRIQWREGDSVPSVIDWHEHSISAPSSNQIMPPRAAGDDNYTVLIEDVEGIKTLTVDAADITSVTLSDAYAEPPSYSQPTLLGSDVYWDGFDTGSFVARTQPGGSVEALTTEVSGDFGYALPSMSPEAVTGEVIVAWSVGGGDIVFRALSDPTPLETFGPDDGDYFPGPFFGQSRIVAGRSWHAVGVEQYVSGGGRVAGAHLFFFGWPANSFLRFKQRDDGLGLRYSGRAGGAAPTSQQFNEQRLKRGGNTYS